MRYKVTFPSEYSVEVEAKTRGGAFAKARRAVAKVKPKFASMSFSQCSVELVDVVETVVNRIGGLLVVKQRVG